jgi:hypothetical protein
MAYEVSTTIEIAATPDNVWAVLVDLANYPKWHPVYLGVTGQLTAGSTLTITTTHPPAAGGTSLVQTGTYHGLGGGRGRAMTKVIGRIQDSFVAINEAIKQQAEARQRALG